MEWQVIFKVSKMIHATNAITKGRDQNYAHHLPLSLGSSWPPASGYQMLRLPSIFIFKANNWIHHPKEMDSTGTQGARQTSGLVWNRTRQEKRQAERAQ
jgi:hypothetical protein